MSREGSGLNEEMERRTRTATVGESAKRHGDSRGGNRSDRVQESFGENASLWSWVARPSTHKLAFPGGSLGVKGSRGRRGRTCPGLGAHKGTASGGEQSSVTRVWEWGVAHWQGWARAWGATPLAISAELRSAGTHPGESGAQEVACSRAVGAQRRLPLGQHPRSRSTFPPW